MKNLGIKTGLFLGALLIILSIFRYTTGMIYSGNQSLSYLYWGIFFLVNISIPFYNKNEKNKRNLIKTGFYIGLTSGLVYLLYIIVLNYVINPELPQILFETSKQNVLSKRGNLNEQNYELQFLKITTNPVVRGFVYILISTFCGIIYAGFGALLLKIQNRIQSK